MLCYAVLRHTGTLLHCSRPHVDCVLCCCTCQAYPFVARKVLRDDGSGTAALLRDLVYDEQGRLRPGRLSALLQVQHIEDRSSQGASLCGQGCRLVLAYRMAAAAAVCMNTSASWHGPWAQLHREREGGKEGGREEERRQ